MGWTERAWYLGGHRVCRGHQPREKRRTPDRKADELQRDALLRRQRAAAEVQFLQPGEVADLGGQCRQPVAGQEETPQPGELADLARPFFDDVEIGQEWESLGRTVTEALTDPLISTDSPLPTVTGLLLSLTLRVGAGIGGST